MGFFSLIRDAAAEANDDVHGERLQRHVLSTLQTFQSLDQRVVAAISLGYLQIRDRLNVEMINWTSEGRIRIARQMQDQARQALDTNVAGAYAKWLAGAWLECGERKSQKARVTLNTLDMYESELRRTIQEVREHQQNAAAEFGL